MKKNKSHSIAKITNNQVTSLSSFFNLLDFALSDNGFDKFWFRGHSDIEWQLIPSALRFEKFEQRNQSLEMHHEFKRLAYNKIERAPTLDDELAWLGLAQHFGIKTRFLDWSENPAIALYFAVSTQLDIDGCVYIINPFDLNFKAKNEKRIFDHNKDKELIRRYLALDGTESNKGKFNTIAINPLYNSERIIMQRGAFTLHGNKQFALDSNQASTLIQIPIKKEFKKRIKNDLERVGIDHMSIFPEVEHVSSYLNNKFF